LSSNKSSLLPARRLREHLREIRRHAQGRRSGRGVKLFTSVFDDARLLPHFLSHYANARVTEFFIATSPEFADELDKLRGQYRITSSPADIRHSHSLGATATTDIAALRGRYQRDGEWVVIVDLDEFVSFPGGVVSVIAAADAEGANVVRGVMYDRFSADGRTVDFEPDGDLKDRYPVRSRFIRDVMLGCDYKAVLVKGQLQGVPGAEHHVLVGEQVASRELEIDHYKWTAGSVERLKERCELLKAAGTDWWIEYDRAIQHYETHGRFAWEEFGGELSQTALPEWEFVPEGWDRKAATRGWSAADVARSYRQKWPQFLEAVQGPGPLGLDHEVPLGTPMRRDDPLVQNAVLAWAYALARAAEGSRALSVLDWGGALGHHYVFARQLFPELELEYHCRELPAVCEEGREVLPEVNFHDDDGCLQRSYDLVLASNSLQYEQDWRARLRSLAHAASPWLFLTRVPLAQQGGSFVVLQRAYRYGYATEYIGWVLSRDDVLETASQLGLSLVREFVLFGEFAIEGAPATLADRALLLRRDMGAA
jgi:putative methyltransferase (TIGR04325 family)